MRTNDTAVLTYDTWKATRDASDLAASAVGIAAIVAAIAAAQGLLFWWQLGKMDESTKQIAAQFQQEHRPFLRVEVEIVNGLEFDKNAGKIILGVKIINCGKSPAFYSWPAAEMWCVGFDFPSAKDRQFALAVHERRNDMPVQSDIPFPDQYVYKPTQARMRITDIEEFVKARKGKTLNPFIVGCVTYEPMSQSARYQTGFIFQLANNTNILATIEYGTPIPKRCLYLETSPYETPVMI